MENTQVTVPEVLQDSIRTISSIMLPVSMSDTANELKRVAQNLSACINFIAEQEQQAQAQANPTESPSESTEGESVSGGNDDGRETDPA